MASILVVDDEKPVADLIRTALGRSGHEVEVAQDVEVALRRLAENRYDLVLSDLRMPGAGGPKPFLERAAEVRDDIRWLIVSGYVGVADEEALRGRPGVVGVLRKPFNIKDLRETVAGVLSVPEAP